MFFFHQKICRSSSNAENEKTMVPDTINIMICLYLTAVETGNVLLILECWQDVHPALVSIPVKWEYSSPYGLLYALNPPDDVMQFENNGA